MRFTGRLISIAEAIVDALILLGVELVVIGARPCPSRAGRCASCRPRVADELLSVRAPAALITARRGTREISPRYLSSINALPKALELPRLPPGTTIQSGTSQRSPSRTRIDDRFLPFEAERIDRVHQVDAQPVGDLPDALHGIVEVADDLDRQRPMIERLGELAVGDLARTDEDDRAKSEIGRRAVDGQGRRGVARAGTGDSPGRNHASMRERRGHAVVFEAAGGIHPLVLEPERAGIEADVLADLVGALEQGLTFADRDDLVGGRTAAARGTARRPKSQRVVALRPLRLEFCEPARDGQRSHS